MQVQNKNILTMVEVEEYFRKIAPSTNTQNIRSTYGRNNNFYANSRVQRNYAAATSVQRNYAAAAAVVPRSTGINNPSIYSRMRNNERNNGRGRPVAAYNRTNDPIVRRNGFNHVRRPLQNNSNINNTNTLPECTHCLVGGHRKEQCYRFKNGCLLLHD
jgi:hypothetical protein